MRNSASLRNPERHCGSSDFWICRARVAPVGLAQAAGEVALADQPHLDIGGSAVGRDRDVEIGDAPADIRDDACDLRAAIRPGAIVDMDAHRSHGTCGSGRTLGTSRNSAPNAILKKPSKISASVKLLRSLARRFGDLRVLGLGE